MSMLIALRQHTKLGTLLFGQSLRRCHALSVNPSSMRHHGMSAVIRLHNSCGGNNQHAPLRYPFITSRCSSLNSIDTSRDNGNEMLDVDSIADLLRISYSSGETDQVQDAIGSKSVLPLLLESNQFANTNEVSCHMIDAAVKAATESNRLNRGALSSIINAILACCCASEMPNGQNNADETIGEKYAELAWEILNKMDEMYASDESSMVAPDLVALSLTYYSSHVAYVKHTESKAANFYLKVQTRILERAQKLAKKNAGSARRRALAAERRKKASLTSDDINDALKALYGQDMAILHENDDLIILSKPAGMVCYHTKKTGAGKITTSRKKKSRDKMSDNETYGTKALDISLEDALLDIAIPLSTLNPNARGIVHRIDRGTSGIIVLAKNDDAHLKLVALFFLRKVQKKYFALVPACPLDGELLLSPEGVIDLPVDGRSAYSKYRILDRYIDPSQKEEGSDPTALLLEVQTLTGRKHQVRVHCAIGLRRPIFLDPLYSEGDKSKVSNSNDKKSKSDETIPAAILHAAAGSNEHFFLHASTMSIPDLNINNVSSPLPQWWKDVIEQWDEVK
jgi:23S rRNA-/tRNA-specific pseudouridylate synthase